VSSFSRFEGKKAVLPGDGDSSKEEKRETGGIRHFVRVQRRKRAFGKNCVTREKGGRESRTQPPKGFAYLSRKGKAGGCSWNKMSHSGVKREKENDVKEEVRGCLLKTTSKAFCPYVKKPRKAFIRVARKKNSREGRSLHNSWLLKGRLAILRGGNVEKKDQFPKTRLKRDGLRRR